MNDKRQRDGRPGVWMYGNDNDEQRDSASSAG